MMVNLLRNHVTRRLLVCILLLHTCVVSNAQAGVNSNASKKVTIRETNMPLVTILKKIERQTKLRFNYQPGDLNEKKLLSVSFVDKPLDEVLSFIVKPDGIKWFYIEDAIALQKIVPAESTERNLHTSLQDSILVVTGVVVNNDGLPLVGATVLIRGTSIGTVTNERGGFRLANVPQGSSLAVSYTGYTQRIVSLSEGSTRLHIKLYPADNKLDEAVVMAYGTTSVRMNTGSIVKIKAEDIARQPVSNVLGALPGRVPGMIVTENNGNPGSKFKVQIRGRSSIGGAVVNNMLSPSNSQPLFLIDGVPFPSTDIGLTNTDIAMANGGQSPFASISPQDIASIEVLKDADATAIYGSRGANGVILISTKKGAQGKTQFNANVYTGGGKVTRKIDYLNTEQYLSMRREAFRNDGVTPTAANAGDLMAWDTTRYNDWQEILIGGTAHITNANASLSGGNAHTTFLISGNYNRQTTVYPGDFSDERAGVHLNIGHTSSNGKFIARATVLYSNDRNNLLQNDLSSYINLAPNAPGPFDKQGQLVWNEGGYNFANPFQYILRKSNVTTDNLNTSMTLSYEVLPGLAIRSTGGYSNIHVNQLNTNPIASRAPATNITGTADFGNSWYKNWILEPQVEYTRNISRGKLNVLVGTTFQRDNRYNSLIHAEGYTNDELIESPQYAGTAAQSVRATIRESVYKYHAVFARLNYNWDRRYLVNLTGRRDGSSRFGPGRQFANFGAIGAGWIFSEEPLMKSHVPFISFGKVRGSYGVTGSDQIEDYAFFDTYNNTNYGPGLIPTRLFNPDYAWEVNKKLELALELGLLKDRIFLITNWYQNRSSSQLVSYKIPIQTGFNTMIRNFGALVQNSGWEFTLNTTNVKRADFNWSTGVNITIERNKLLDFPDLDKSAYASALIIGRSLNIVKFFDLLGVNNSTGVYEFAGTDRPQDLTVIKDLTPLFYGGMSNNLTYKDWNLSFFIQFAKQDGYNFLNYNPGNPPGTLLNQPVDVLRRWQKPGDNTDIQRFATTGAPRTAYSYYALYSEAKITDASYARLKNLSLSYTLPQNWLHRIRVASVRIYLQAQNLFTLTNYKGTDPETNSGGITNLPPLRILTGGIQLTL